MPLYYCTPPTSTTSMPDFRLTNNEIAILKAEHREQRDREKADRIRAIVLFGSGGSVSEVAQALLLD